MHYFQRNAHFSEEKYDENTNQERGIASFLIGLIKRLIVLLSGLKPTVAVAMQSMATSPQDTDNTCLSRESFVFFILTTASLKFTTARLTRYSESEKVIFGMY